MDPDRLAALLDAGVGKEPFRRDLEDARRFGVRVFPTLLFHGPEGTLALVGDRPYGDLEAAVREVELPKEGHDTYGGGGASLLRARNTRRVRGVDGTPDEGDPAPA